MLRPSRHASFDRRQSRPRFFQLLRGNAGNAANELFVGGLSCQHLMDKSLCRLKIAPRKERLALELLIGNLAPLFIERSKAVRNRIGAHRQHCRLYLFRRIRNAGNIQLPVHLLIRDFLGIIVDTFYFLLRIGLRQKTVEPQVAMNSHLYRNFFYRHRRCRLPGFLGVIVVANLVLQCVELRTGIAFHKSRRKIRNRCCIRTPFGDHTFADIADGVIIEVRDGSHQTVGPIVTA